MLLRDGNGRPAALRLPYINVQPYPPRKLPLFCDRLPSSKGLPRSATFTEFNDNVADTMLDYRDSRVIGGGGGYATHLARSSSDGNFTGYAWQLYDDDDDDGISSVSRSHLSPPTFLRPGLRRNLHVADWLLRYRPGEEDEVTPTDHTAADDSQASSNGRRACSDRHGRRTSVDDDAASSASNFQPSGMSPRYYFTFGLGPDTMLTGSQGSLTSCVTADEAETTVREGRGKKTATSQQSSVPVMEWLRNRRRRPSNAVKIELEQRSGKSSVFRKDSDSVSENNVGDRYTKPVPTSSLLGVTTELVVNDY